MSIVAVMYVRIVERHFTSHIKMNVGKNIYKLNKL